MAEAIQLKEKTIIYEQPIHEHLRICLRLEQLLAQLNEALTTLTSRNAEIAVTTLLRITDVIDRPDIKSKLTQMLTQYATTLGQLERFPQVDKERLKQTLSRLDEFIQLFHRIQGRLGEILRTNEFLNQLRQQLLHPGGIFLHHSPAFALWLQQPIDTCHRDLIQWVEALHPLPDVTKLILEITRQSTKPQIITANHGFHQQALDTTLPVHMIIVEVDIELGTYAEISAGKHRLSIRFLQPNYLHGERPKQISAPITFRLTCCRF